MKKLYTPCKIGGLTVRNRVMLPALNLSCATSEGFCTERIIEFYRTRAAGGAGLIMAGACGVDPERINTVGVLQISNDKYIPGLERLTQAVHVHGARIFAQLWHPGAYARSREFSGQQAVAPSAVVSGFSREMPRALSTAEVEGLVDLFGRAALRAKMAGFDGVELSASAGYLISQFLSSKTNKRTDKYGGVSAVERMTFLEEAILAIRSYVGGSFPLMVRIAGNEFTKGGNGSDDSAAIAKKLCELPVDAISVTGGWHETVVPQLTMDVPPAAFSYLGQMIQEISDIPVAACNRLDILEAERLVESGVVQLAAMGRACIADPDIVVKAMEGRYSEIIPCIGCNQGCMDNIFKEKPLACLVNPSAGKECERINSEASPPKKILVIGAGAAGMQFAVLAAEKGHSVEVWEKSDRPGGLLNIAARAFGRSDFSRLVKYFTDACNRFGVNVILNREASAGSLFAERASGFDLIAIASGGLEKPLTFSADSGASIVNARDIIVDKAIVGHSVTVIGSGTVAVEAAAKVAREGTITPEQLWFLTLHKTESQEKLYSLMTHGTKSVTIIPYKEKLGYNIGPSTKWNLLGDLNRFGVEKKTGEIVKIKQDGVLLKDEDGEQKLLPADTVAVEMEYAPNKELCGLLGDKNVLVIGDAAGPGNLYGAIRSAYKAASAL